MEGGDGVVELEEDDGGDADVGVDDAEGGAGGIPELGDDDAAAEGGFCFEGDIFADEVGADGEAPGGVEEEAEEEDVGPVDEECGAVGEEVGEEAGGEGHEGDEEEVGEVKPGEVAVGFFDAVKLGLLADPEDAEGKKGHEVDEEVGGEVEKLKAEVGFGVDEFFGGGVEVEEEEGHGDAEDAVGEGGEAFDASACEGVVGIGHGFIVMPRDGMTNDFLPQRTQMLTRGAE
jgi:hypothetical protein